MNRRVIALLGVLLAIVFVHNAFSNDHGWGSDHRIKGSGELKTVTQDLDEFHAVSYGTLGTLYIEIGDKEQLEIEAEDNLIEHFEAVVRNGKLIIRNSEDHLNLSPRRPVKFYLTVRALDEIRILSSGDIVAPDFTAKRFTITTMSSGDLKMGTIQCDAAEITVLSSGDVTLEGLTADELDVEISSSGDVSIGDGRVTEQTISINSSGDYDARNVKSERVHARTLSSGDIRVNVSEQLEARTTSSGDIVYYGNPRVNMHESSSGDVRHARR